jgi:hypothetical protein
MNWVTGFLPKELSERVAREASRRRSSVSAVVRLALGKHLQASPSEAPRRLPFANIGRSGDPQLARKLDEVLAKGYGRAGHR